MARAAVKPTGRESPFGVEEIIVSKTDLKGRVTYANHVFARISRFSISELIGAPHSLVRHPDMPRCVFKLLWDTIQARKEIFAYVLNMAKNGDHYWVFAHVTPSLDKAGAAAGDLEARCREVGEGGEVADLLRGINHMLDIVDAFVRESGASMDYVSRGKHFRKVLERGLPGSFRTSAAVINAATAAIDRKVRDFAGFTDLFEGKVGAVVETVSAAATETESSARSMAVTAEHTSRQSTIVAAASEQASTNVQTVAAAAEALSHSVAEIGRQVAESAKTTQRAVEEVRRSEVDAYLVKARSV